MKRSSTPVLDPTAVELLLLPLLLLLDLWMLLMLFELLWPALAIAPPPPLWAGGGGTPSGML